MYLTVVTTSRQRGIGNGLTYASGSYAVVPGQLVRVPLRGNVVEAIVIECTEQKPDGDFDVKEIAGVIPGQLLLSTEQIHLIRWMAEYYCCTLRHCLQVFLPGTPWSKLLPQPALYVRLKSTEESSKRLGKQQQRLVDHVSGKDWVSWHKIQEETGIAKSVLRRLIDGNMLEVQERMCSEYEFSNAPMFQSSNAPMPQCSNAPTLTEQQQSVFDAIRNDSRPTLLFGVTGSGKTEVYAALIADAVKYGKSALLLLPEILLTENFIDRFEQLIHRDAIALLHSRLTPAQRRDAWQRIRSGQVQLVIGSRSALFAPLQNMGVIIIDEEHEWTYKNEQTPRYHAVRVAEEYARCASARLIVGTATPSVETWYKATRCADMERVSMCHGEPDESMAPNTSSDASSRFQSRDETRTQYQLCELPERYGGASLPAVRVIDMAQVSFDAHYPFSPALLDAIRQRLDRKEQTVLFLNRRGFATSLLCLECRYRFTEPASGLPYTVHDQGQSSYLLSHHTGERIGIPGQCPSCGSTKLRPVGAGTQKVEAVLQKLFPSARLLRADADTLKHPEQMRSVLAAMKERRADILLGTQSVVKGLDLPGVTLAAVLLADIGLSLPHFRAGERVFQLLTQLTGRSGRHDAGDVIIQTFRPDAIEVALSAQHAVRAYLHHELSLREKMHYPPYTQMVRFVFSGDAAEADSAELNAELATIDSLHVSRAPSLFGAGKIWHILVRGDDVSEAIRVAQKSGAIIDRDPLECM